MKPKINQIEKTCFTVSKMITFEVTMKVWANNSDHADELTNDIQPIDYSDTVGVEIPYDELDANGDYIQICDEEVLSSWLDENSSYNNIEDTGDTMTLFQCAEDEGDEDYETFFTSKEDAVEYWETMHKDEEGGDDE